MRRFAGEVFNNIRPLKAQDLPDIDIATPDDLPKIIARNIYIDRILEKQYQKEQKLINIYNQERNKFQFNVFPDTSTGSPASQLEAYKRWVERESVDLGDGRFLNIAPERLNKEVFDLKGKAEAQMHEQAQKKLASMIKKEIYNKRALENEAQSFNNIMEQGLINVPIAENRIAGKRRERERMNNIAFLKEELQEEDRLAELRMQKAADEYFGRTPPPKQTGNGLWEGAPLVPDSGDIPF